jgi:hypothetical protein
MCTIACTTIGIIIYRKRGRKDGRERGKVGKVGMEGKSMRHKKRGKYRKRKEDEA